MGMPGMGGMGMPGGMVGGMMDGMPSFGMNEFNRPRGGRFGGERRSMPISAMGGVARGGMADVEQGGRRGSPLKDEQANQSFGRESMMRNQRHHGMGGEMGGGAFNVPPRGGFDDRMDMMDDRMNGGGNGRRVGGNQRPIRPNGSQF